MDFAQLYLGPGGLDRVVERRVGRVKSYKVSIEKYLYLTEVARNFLAITVVFTVAITSQFICMEHLKGVRPEI